MLLPLAMLEVEVKVTLWYSMDVVSGGLKKMESRFCSAVQVPRSEKWLIAESIVVFRVRLNRLSPEAGAFVQSTSLDRV